MFTAAASQLTSTSREDENLATAAALIGRAANAGAAFVATPENTNFLGPHADKVARAEPIGGRVTTFFADLARKHKLHVLLGGHNEKAPEANRCYNTSVLFGPDGDARSTCSTWTCRPTFASRSRTPARPAPIPSW